MNLGCERSRMGAGHSAAPATTGRGFGGLRRKPFGGMTLGSYNWRSTAEIEPSREEEGPAAEPATRCRLKLQARLYRVTKWHPRMLLHPLGSPVGHDAAPGTPCSAAP